GVVGVEDAGEMEHNPRKNVLWRRREPAADDERLTLVRALGKLKAARDRRPAPAVDTTAYVSWNAMMAAAFLQAGAVLDRPPCNTLALAVLERIWTEAWREERGLAHVLGRETAGPHGMLDDNVQSAAAFLDAYESTGDERWLDRATRVMARCATAHWDEAAGGYFDLARDRGGAAYLGTRAKPVQDAPTPSPNGVAALVLARLWALTDKKEWRAKIDRQLAPFAGTAGDMALYGAMLLRA